MTWNTWPEKLKEEYEKWGLTINLAKKPSMYVYIGEEGESLKLEGGEEIQPTQNVPTEVQK